MIRFVQIRVVNAFQEPSSTPAQLPYKGRPSFASIVSMAARAAAATAVTPAAAALPPPAVSPEQQQAAATAVDVVVPNSPKSPAAVVAQQPVSDVFDDAIASDDVSVAVATGHGGDAGGRIDAVVEVDESTV